MSGVGVGGGRLRLCWLGGDLSVVSVVRTLRSLNICVCSAGSGGETAQPAQASPAVLQSERKSLNKSRNRTGYTDPLSYPVLVIAISN